jgi:hypothetical protein
MTAPAQLAAMQQWLLATIADPAPIDASAVCRRITASRQQVPEERLGVYQQAYFARLLDVLRELFPCTRFAVGDETFDALATGYIIRHPPHSYTLAQLADDLPQYLDETRPRDGEWGRFIVELAQLEQSIDRIFDGPGPELLPQFTLAGNADGSLRLKLVPGFEQHSFTFPISTFYTDWKNGRLPTWPQPREQHVALWRRNYIVRRWELSAPQMDLLRAIQNGDSLGDALAAAADAADQADLADLAGNVRQWFAQWAAAGLFVG